MYFYLAIVQQVFHNFHKYMGLLMSIPNFHPFFISILKLNTASPMPNKLYHLASCSTCKRIIKVLGDKALSFEMQDIRTNKIAPAQLDEMKALAGTYEALFSRRSQQYVARGLKDKTLSEQDYRNLILEEYTFLKRPVAIVGKDIFIGNSTEVIAALQEKLAQ